ncbi:hypothetical protein FA13DRAFT_102081 [Coprinellus micaceus]|uniref:Uncharacterized protein n=1 Tax=Coprinellus micaceus TaxID=71717 RepID=A0A4Y7SHY4_COPMI|nr:hypothetical protein FA13DRAFT_102081 [Coprinellus micaceus]
MAFDRTATQAENRGPSATVQPPQPSAPSRFQRFILRHCMTEGTPTLTSGLPQEALAHQSDLHSLQSLTTTWLWLTTARAVGRVRLSLRPRRPEPSHPRSILRGHRFFHLPSRLQTSTCRSPPTRGLVRSEQRPFNISPAGIPLDLGMGKSLLRLRPVR